MIYAYRCRTCGATFDSTDRADSLGCECGAQAGRDFSGVQFGRSAFQPHFNHAVGAHVSTRHEFEALLSQRAEENTIRTGIDHHYTPVDPGDVPRPTVDDHIFETQEKAWRDKKAPAEQVVMS